VTEKLSNAETRRLKAAAQRLKATFKVGKAGLSAEFVRGLDAAFQHHELIKVKFDEHKEEKKTLAPQLAEKTSSHLVWLIGNVAVLYRQKPDAPEPLSKA
jgi:RNA-binding protein